MPSNSNAALSAATAPVAVGSSRKAPREPKSRRAPRSKPITASSDRPKSAAEPEFRILTQNGPSKPIAKPDGLLPNPSAGKRAKQSRRSSMPTSVSQPSSTAVPVVPIIHSAPVLAPPSTPPRSPDLKAQSPPNTEVFLMSPQHFRTSPPRSNSSSPGSRDSESSALLAYFTQCSSPTSSASQLAKHERWAGGAFQNSPDPSALPLPDFETIPTTSSSAMPSATPQPTTAPIPMPSRPSSATAPLLPASPIAMHHYPAPPPPSPAHAAPQPYYPAPFFAMPANPYMHSQSAPPVPSYYGFMAQAPAPAPAPNTADLSNDLRKMLNIHAF